MRKIKEPKLIWKYTGDESPEKKREAETSLHMAYNRIFGMVRDRLLEKKRLKQKSSR